MIPLSLTLKGSLGIKAGLGRDAISLDLSDIPDDAITVALKGDNGSGKSTLINLGMVPWLDPPQINGNAYDHFGEKGVRLLTWSHGNEQYRSRIEYRNTGKTRNTKAFLHVLRGDDWRPTVLPDKTESDGKTSTYKACLEHILGPQEIYYLSAFRAQGAARLAEYDDPKGLMRALLGLDEPAALAKKANEVAKELDRQLDAIRGQAEALDERRDRVLVLETEIADLERSRADLAKQKLAAISAASRARSELDAALRGDIDRQRLLDQRAAVERRLHDETARWADEVSRMEAELGRVRQRLALAEGEQAATMRSLEHALQAANDRIASAERTLANRDAILAAQARVADLSAQIDAQEKSVETQRSNIDKLRDLVAQVSALKRDQKRLGEAVQTCRSRVVELSMRAGFAERVPCRGEGEFAECPALREAIAAKGQIEAVKEDAGAKEAEAGAIDAQLASLGREIEQARPAEAAYSVAMDLIKSLRNDLESIRRTAERASALEVAEESLATAKADALRADMAIVNHETACEKHEQSLNQEIADTWLAVRATREAAQTALQRIREELGAIPELESDEVVRTARERVSQAEKASERVAADLAQTIANISDRGVEKQRISDELKLGQKIFARANHLESELENWRLLTKALRGVIDLSIEDAGPSIANAANRLLAEAYGPRFALRIVTQREQQNGRTVETFDISVIDSETGHESSVLRKSGGEGVWLDKALTDAVGLHHQDAAGIHYECLFADEAEDGLTQERKAQFYRMDRRALDMGGYRRKYFVSHNPDAWDYADHVIDMSDLRLVAHGLKS